MNKQRVQLNGLSLLLDNQEGDKKVNDFFNTAWPNKSYVHHGDISRFTHCGSVFNNKPLEEILADIGRPVDAIAPGGFRVTCSNPLDAIAHYNDNQAMIYMSGLHLYDEIQHICHQLALDLGIPKRFITCEGFAARKGSKVSLHFDHDTNFMVQIRGQKIWGIQENNILSNPLHCYFADKPNRFYEEGVHPFSGIKINDNLPQQSNYFEVGPGTTTFLPRGFWHLTEALEDSFSIGFVIDPPTLLEMTFAYLSRKLHADTRWRAHPLCFADQSGVNAEPVIEELRVLLKQLESISATEVEHEIVENCFSEEWPKNVREYQVGY